MALGRGKNRQTELFTPTAQLARGSGHPFYTKLNAVLAEAGFDELVEQLSAPYYKGAEEEAGGAVWIIWLGGAGPRRPIHQTLNPVASRPLSRLVTRKKTPLY